MNPMTPKRTRRLRARAATMNPAEEYDDYGPEPNMKLSHAFLVVLLLHVIAVAGLYAFNSMKAGKVPVTKIAKAPVPSAPAQQASGNRDNSPGGGCSGSGEKPPIETKAPLMAKVSEAPKPSKSATEPVAKSTQVTGSGNGGGLFASARAALQKTAGVGAVAAGSSKAIAQSVPPDSSNAVTSAEAATPAASPAKTYTVRSGDTMTRISSTLGVAIPDLEKVNGIASNAVLQVGQLLKVPERIITQAAAGVAAGEGKLSGAIAAAGTAQEQAAAPATTEYTVVKGDNPWKIAKKFKISQDALIKANGITDPKKIQIGQQLKVPAQPRKVAK